MTAIATLPSGLNVVAPNPVIITAFTDVFISSSCIFVERL